MILQRNADIPCTRMGDELVFMDIETGKYFSLKGTGAAIWELLAEPREAAALYALLADEYRISPAQCQADTAPFLQRLQDAGLIRCLPA